MTAAARTILSTMLILLPAASAGNSYYITIEDGISFDGKCGYRGPNRTRIRANL